MTIYHETTELFGNLVCTICYKPLRSTFSNYTFTILSEVCYSGTSCQNRDKIFSKRVKTIVQFFCQNVFIQYLKIIFRGTVPLVLNPGFFEGY